MWSAGCVLVEMLIGQPLFPGESSLDQLVEIMKILGSPSNEEIEDMKHELKDMSIPPVPPKNWRDVLPENVPRTADVLIG